MAITPFSIPKASIAHLQDVPRDIFDSVQGITGAARVYRNIAVDNYGIGLDLSIVNDITAAATATVIIDGQKTITIAPGGSFTLNNIVWVSVEVPVGAGVVLSIFYAGVSNELMARLVK